MAEKAAWDFNIPTRHLLLCSAAQVSLCQHLPKSVSLLFSCVGESWHFVHGSITNMQIMEVSAADKDMCIINNSCSEMFICEVVKLSQGLMSTSIFLGRLENPDSHPCVSVI